MTANRKLLAVETMEKSGERLDNCENVNHNPATFLSQQKNNRTTKPHDTYTADTLGYKKGNAQVGTFGTVETMESDVEMQETIPTTIKSIMLHGKQHAVVPRFPSGNLLETRSYSTEVFFKLGGVEIVFKNPL